MNITPTILQAMPKEEKEPEVVLRYFYSASGARWHCLGGTVKEASPHIVLGEE